MPPKFQMDLKDTIVAISSASGSAARMIVRTSGDRALGVARSLCPEIAELSAADLAAAAKHVTLRFAGLACPAWVYCFIAPRSYTGEDLIEYHLPGSPVLARLLVAELQRLGLRAAEPGEFTARAFFNGRIDLTEAEGVAATIAAGSDQELAAARMLLAGELARRLEPAMELLTLTLALLEADLDFSDESLPSLDAAEVRTRINHVHVLLDQLLADSGRFEKLAHEPSFVLAGRPNAGKSSLLNALAGFERAVASPVAGTTRDALWATVNLPRGRVRVYDVAGVEETAFRSEAAEENASPLAPLASIEAQMRGRAMQMMQEADFVVLLEPLDSLPPPLRLPRPADLILYSKLDLASPIPMRNEDVNHLTVSVVTGDGLQRLRQRLDELAFGRGGSEARLALNIRHVAAINHAREALQAAATMADAISDAAGAALRSPELCAAELREALDALGQVLGQVSPDDLLGRIFSQFCIGK